MIKSTLIAFTTFFCITTQAQSELKLMHNNIDEVIMKMSLKEKTHMLIGVGTFFSPKSGGIFGATGGVAGSDRFGIPLTYLADGPSGLRINDRQRDTKQRLPTTNYPSSIALASTWNVEMAQLMGISIGDECRDYGVSMILAPALNIIRFPLIGRMSEYYSEDPLLAGEIAANYVLGVQKGGTGTSIKHFVANNQETARKLNNVIISERALREVYMKGFEYTVKTASPWAVMSSYNKINGVYTSQNHWLLQDVLRNEWGFKGFVMSDWDAGMDAVAQVNAGNDIIQPGYESQCNAIIDAVKSGKLSETIIDRNIKRILDYVVKTHIWAGDSVTNKTDINKHATDARHIADEGIIMLKNKNHVLPMKVGAKVSVYGNTAYNVRGLNKRCVLLDEGLSARGFNVNKNLHDTYWKNLGYENQPQQAKMSGNMLYTTFSSASTNPEPQFTPEDFSKQALNNDYAIIVFGKNAGESKDCTSKDFLLGDENMKLLNRVCHAFHAKGKKVVVVLDVAIAVETASWKNLPDAILLAWPCGQEKGNSLADIMSGAVNPSGKLTITLPTSLKDEPAYDNWPVDTQYDWNYAQSGLMDSTKLPKDNVRNIHYSEYKEGIYVGYRYFDHYPQGISYPFGYGLSYTSFNYSNPFIKREGDKWNATITVTNSGKKAGREVVELYVAAPKGTLDKPEKELKGFAKTKMLQPNESQTITLPFTTYQLCSFNENNKTWEADKGKYKAIFASSSTDIREICVFSLKKVIKKDVHSKSLNF